jgi:hypothetical protein
MRISLVDCRNFVTAEITFFSQGRGAAGDPGLIFLDEISRHTHPGARQAGGTDQIPDLIRFSGFGKANGEE